MVAAADFVDFCSRRAEKAHERRAGSLLADASTLKEPRGRFCLWRRDDMRG